MSVIEVRYMVPLLSWSGIDFVIGCAFVVEALGFVLVLVRERSRVRIKWLVPVAPLALGVWAFLLGRYASDSYQRLAAGPCPICRSYPSVVVDLWRARIVETFTLVRLESVLLLATCFVGFVVVLFMRRRPGSMPRTVSRGALAAAL